ncbi:MAG: hypothetical protein LBE56_14320 [Tannerella sp.]|jgi:hypothetical protein|nr:hypothetical protein [Tannerella sp.]
MKLSISKYLVVLVLFAVSLGACDKNDDIDISQIDFSNIEDLYAKPLPVIQKCVEGKWKWDAQFGGDAGITYLENTFVDIYNDYYIVDKDGNQRTQYFTWKKKSFKDHGTQYKTWVMWDDDSNGGLYYFLGIKNDTLGVGLFPSGGVTFNQFSNSFIRIK